MGATGSGRVSCVHSPRFCSPVCSTVVRVVWTMYIDDGTTSTIDMSNKWSTTIAKELMDLAGGEPWQAYKAAALAAGHPILPGEENERLAQVARRHPASAQKAAESPEEMEAQVQAMLNAPSRPKTGAAAILP